MRTWLSENGLALAFVGGLALLGGITLTLPPGAPTATPTRSTTTGVNNANEANFDELVLASDRPVLVDFYADWCGPCRRVAPVVEQLARDVPEIRVVQVNIDHSRNLAKRYNVRSIPQLKVFRDGQEVESHTGVASRSELLSMLGLPSS